MADRHKVLLIGPFPPPLHGMSLVNDLIRERIRHLGIHPVIINLSPKSLNRVWYARISRVPKVLLGLIRFLTHCFFNKSRTIYLSISGGYGQIYDIFFIMLGRLSGCRKILHHHNYTYLLKPNTITRVLMRIAGKKTMHITLCNDMAKRLRRHYGCVDNVDNIVVISNAALIRLCIPPYLALRDSLKKIGFIGNISDAKGIFEFLDVFRYLSEKHPNLNIHGLIAGPFEDAKVERQVLSDLKDLANVSYVGPKYESEKVDFFRSIDALLFPTKNEAEPLTIHEAMATGLPVIAWQRGCIKDIISSESGFVVNQQDDFVKSAVEQILLWALSPEEYRRVSVNAYNHFIDLRKNYKKKLNNLLEQMVGH
jgi:glycosyltransferase involved in cell wall biosynthesis